MAGGMEHRPGSGSMATSQLKNSTMGWGKEKDFGEMSQREDGCPGLGTKVRIPSIFELECRIIIN